MRRYQAALAGYYGFGNLGDELLAEASLAALYRCGVDRDRVVLMSGDPAESGRKFGVDAIDRWSVWQVRRALRQSETLLLGGGGLFQDVSSLRSCFYYWGLVRAALFCGAVPWALGQSVGPLTTRAGLALTRDALRRCRVLQVRDAASAELCASMGLSVETGEDLALSLPVGTADTEGEASKVSKRLLVNLRPHAGGLSERFAAALSERAAGLELVGVALSEEDERLMNRFAMEGRLALSRVERLWGAADAARVFREGMAAGMRLHFVILAAMAGLPLVAVPYDPKVEGFAVSHNVPLWREGPMPEARSARFPGGFSALGVRGEIDALCRKILRQT